MKSLDYIKERTKDEDYVEYIEVSSIDFLKEFIEHDFEIIDGKLFTLGDEERDVLAEIYYSQDDDYNYYSSDGNINDGTLMFYWQSVGAVFNKLLHIQTVNRTIVEKYEPIDFDKYYFKYTIGDIILGRYNAEPPEDRKWLTNGIHAMLPIKFEVVER